MGEAVDGYVFFSTKQSIRSRTVKRTYRGYPKWINKNVHKINTSQLKLIQIFVFVSNGSFTCQLWVFQFDVIIYRLFMMGRLSEIIASMERAARALVFNLWNCSDTH